MNDENECYIHAKNGLALFEYLIAMMATLLMIVLGILTSDNIFDELVIFIDLILNLPFKLLCLSYCKYMTNINYLSICIFQATVKEVSRTSFAKLKPDTNDISFRVTKDINFPNIFALGRKKLI